MKNYIKSPKLPILVVRKIFKLTLVEFTSWLLDKDILIKSVWDDHFMTKFLNLQAIYEISEWLNIEFMNPKLLNPMDYACNFLLLGFLLKPLTKKWQASWFYACCRCFQIGTAWLHSHLVMTMKRILLQEKLMEFYLIIVDWKSSTRNVISCIAEFVKFANLNNDEKTPESLSFISSNFIEVFHSFIGTLSI